jgi:hypothetical protein
MYTSFAYTYVKTVRNKIEPVKFKTKKNIAKIESWDLFILLFNSGIAAPIFAKFPDFG